MSAVHPLRSDLGPVLPPRLAVRRVAVELRELSARAVEFAGTGPTADLALALRQLDRMRAILGTLAPGSGAEAGEQHDG